jgi:hypothetical protein
MSEYRIVFPRWNEDIATHRRTLVHIPCDPGVDLKQGDQLIILRRHSESRGIRVEIVETGQVKLVNSLATDGDWIRLNLADRDDGFGSDASRADAFLAYGGRWDDVNPDVPWASNPTVWRVVFRYLPEMTPPEYATST